jgi:type I restriction enzyme S subunit
MTSILFPSCPKEIQDEIVEYKKNKVITNSVLKQAESDFQNINLVHQNLKLILSENEKQTNIVSQLKQAILQEAIAGQLTAEWRTENPMQKGNPDTDAAALLAKIKSEKQQAIADGKLKKEKPLAEIAIDEIPFSIPDSWVWCRLGQVCKKITDGTHHSPINTDTGKYKYITAKNIKDFGVDLSNVTFIDQAIHEEIFQRCDPENGDILFIKDGATTGIVTINNLEEPFSLLSSVALLKPLILNKYLMYSMRSPIFYNSTRDAMSGVAITRVTLHKIINAIIPLPPLAEQKAIVQKVDKLMNIIDRLEQQIKHRKQLAENLMQTVLREAFE